MMMTDMVDSHDEDGTNFYDRKNLSTTLFILVHVLN